jgi:ferric-dicitrate binding protein FerR (iron transport regulator)
VSKKPHTTGDTTAVAQAAKPSRKVLQLLHASDNHGSFRTNGRYSAATVLGTDWTVEDRCDGTLTKVKRGRVNVLDFHTDKTITLRAGQSFLANAGR